MSAARISSSSTSLSLHVHIVLIQTTHTTTFPQTLRSNSYLSSVEATQSFQHFPFLEPFFASWEKDWWPYGPFLEVAGLTTPTDQLFSDNWNVPLVLCAVYLILCFGGRVFMSGRAPFDLKYPLAGWNIFLATFSFIGASRTVPQLIANLQIHGLDATMCMSADRGLRRGSVGILDSRVCSVEAA